MCTFILSCTHSSVKSIRIRRHRIKLAVSFEDADFHIFLISTQLLRDHNHNVNAETNTKHIS